MGLVVIFLVFDRLGNLLGSGRGEAGWILCAAVLAMALAIEATVFLLPGLFAQHGIAEETLFRGFAFRHLREHRSFSRAAFLSMILFVATHVYLFTYLSAPIALASTLLSVATAYPLAWLFEKGRKTIWAPALLHSAVHAIKLVSMPEPAMSRTLGWMAVCAVVPWAVFLVPGRWWKVPADATS